MTRKLFSFEKYTIFINYYTSIYGHKNRSKSGKTADFVLKRYFV